MGTRTLIHFFLVLLGIVGLQCALFTPQKIPQKKVIPVSKMSFEEFQEKSTHPLRNFDTLHKEFSKVEKGIIALVKKHNHLILKRDTNTLTFFIPPNSSVLICKKD